MTEQRLRAYIEQVVRRYCDRFWEDHTDVFTFCMAEKDVSGMASYLYPDDYIKQKISDAYYADLMNGQLTSVFQAIKQSLAVQSMKRYQKAMRDYVALMNTNIGVRISDSSWKEGGKSKFAGWKIRFSDIPASVEDPLKWERTINDKGKAGIGYLTVYALIKNNVKCQLTLVNPDGEEKAVYEFKIPAGTGNIICDIDLATGESSHIVPHLANLELEYETNGIFAPTEYYRKGINDEVTSDLDVTETGWMIYLDNSAKINKAYFQAEIEKFFHRHDFIFVDDIGNIRIGDDIVGKFNAEVIDRVYHVFWYDTDIDYSDTKLEDIYTAPLAAEGTVKLKYKTKLKK